MPAISFSGEPRRGPFWKLILSGEKKQTVRSPRCHPIKKGDILTLYWKQRCQIDKKPIHLIGHAICTEVEKLKKFQFIFNSDFAKADGFTDVMELQDWFGLENDWFDYEVIHFEIIIPKPPKPIQSQFALKSKEDSG